MFESERKGRILIVDDDPGVRELLSQVLTEVGNYDTDMAADGVEGLEKVRSNRYDVIFTDLTMPRMNGMDFLQRTREMPSPVPVIVLTGVSSMEIAVSAMRKGAVDFLTKPFTLDKIVSTTERVLGEWKLYGRLASKQGSDDSLKILNAELFKRLQEIGSLHSIGLEVDRCHDNKEIYARVAEMAAKLLAVQSCPTKASAAPALMTNRPAKKDGASGAKAHTPFPAAKSASPARKRSLGGAALRIRRSKTSAKRRTPKSG